MWTERHSFARQTIDKPFNSNFTDSNYQRDRARIIHSASFRSMQSKTQVLGLGESDFYRTRLTHSLEVAQIGSGICERLRNTTKNKLSLEWLPSFSLIEAICLAHDIGHSPFGHGGEVAFNFLMQNAGGFEANGQTLRILTLLGEYSESDGLDLSRRTLLGTIKYPAFYDDLCKKQKPEQPSKSYVNLQAFIPPKCIYRDEQNIFSWILAPFNSDDQKRLRTYKSIDNKHSRTLYKGFDTSIMELADDIAYGVHDLEDAAALGILSKQRWDHLVNDFFSDLEANPISKELDFFSENLFSDSARDRKHAISKLVHYFINAISINEDKNFQHPLLSLQAQMQPIAYKILCLLKDVIMQEVILKPELQALQIKGQHTIIRLFEAFSDNPKSLLPKQVQQTYFETDENQRVICDYIAAMTDISASRHYHRLFSPNTGSIFDRL